ncbi:Chromosome condensation complex Condensin, subunit G [Trachipleistophora hominis]|uniref:Chromosome condensation complex Condensin, subunit G n=1 Tax=Trachipleistophora hominis TaxID=72359 RepID=L7JUB1_TRAHO|nr:Chromosome condensation complex Condensin, subunit G [Trachipleistophora hominis]
MSETTPIHDIFVSLNNNNTLPEKKFYGSIDARTLNEILDYYILTKSQSVPKRVMQFLNLVLDFLEDNKAVLLNGLSYLRTYIDVKNKHVRKNVVHLLGMLIDRLNIILDGNSELRIQTSEQDKLFKQDDNTRDLVRSTIMKITERLFDKEHVIRKEVIKILSPYQDFMINKKTNVRRIFKDLLRYDPCPEIRNRVMMYLITSSSAIERIKDEDMSVRQTFFKVVLPHLKLKNLDTLKRCLILEKSVLEREFNAFLLLKSKIFEEYEFPAEIKNFVGDFLLLNTAEYADDGCKQIEENKKQLAKMLETIFIETSLTAKIFDDTYYENLDLEGAFILHAYLSFVESTKGRESLEMVNLEYFTAILYLKVKQVMEGDQNTRALYFVSLLFQLTNFYDVYEQKQSKYILSTIYKFFTAELPPKKEMLSQLIENGIILASSTDRTTFTNFLGSLITKSKENHTFLFLLCKYVMMHVKPFEMLHTAIISEIVLNNINIIDENSIILEIIFYYLVEKYNENGSLFFKNTNKLHESDGALDNANIESNKQLECANDVSCDILLNLLLEEKYFRPILVVDLFILFEEMRDVIRDKIVLLLQERINWGKY